MGQKVHPYGCRLGINVTWKSKWFSADKKVYAKSVHEDIMIRDYLEAKFKSASVSDIVIERPGVNNIVVVVFSARPGVIIGKKGGDLEKVRQHLVKLTNGSKIQLSIKEVKQPELISKLVAESVAQQLEKRMPFRRVLKRTLQNTMRAGAKGVKVAVSGRLGGAEIARREWQIEGRVPLHTLRAEIDYGVARAMTTYGVIGVKVWIYKGEKQFSVESAEAAQGHQSGDKKSEE